MMKLLKNKIFLAASTLLVVTFFIIVFVLIFYSHSMVLGGFELIS